MKIDKSINDGVYVGTVQNSRLGVKPDDILVTFISTNRSIPIGGGVGALSNIDASLVAFDFKDQEMGGAGHFAFIDKGSGDGVSPGMYVPVYATPGYLTSALGSSDLPVDYEFVGVMRIIDATDAGACGYIVRNTKEFRLGDRTNGKG